MNEKERKDMEALLKTLEQGNELVVWRPKIGDNQIRILPNVEGEKFFHIFFRHWVKQDGKNIPILCSQDNNCRLCKILDPAVSNPQKRVLINLKDRVDNKCYVGEIPVMVFTQILSIVINPQYLDLLDEKKGSDINIKRQGIGLDTQYFVLPYRNVSEVGEFKVENLSSVLKVSTEEDIDKIIGKLRENNNIGNMVESEIPPKSLVDRVKDLPF